MAAGLGQEVFGTLFDVVCNFAGRDILYIDAWRLSLPGRFAALSSKNLEEVNAVLQHCRLVFEALISAEADAHHDELASSFLESLLWPKAAWVREVLVGLCECQW